MNRRELAHLAGLFAIALAVRAVLFTQVGIWGDAGFYIYDARLINQGLTPYIDFIGRSPLFNYSYAWVASWAGNSMATLRAFIVVPWILSGFVCYWIARELRSHHAGLAAFAVMNLSPFMLVYGYWANTQSVAALLAISGVALLVYREDRYTYALSGLLFGLAFLSRRSVITVMAAVALWMAYRTWLADDRPQAFAQRFAFGIVFLGGVATALISMYAWMGGDVQTTIALAETHAWGLVASSGRGGFPLLTEATPPPVTNRIEHGRVPIFNDLCQMCGAWTARTFAKTIMVTVPVIGPLFVYFRDWSDRWFTDALRAYTFGILLLLAGYGIVEAALAGYYVRIGVALALVGYGVLAFRVPAIDRSVLYDQRLALVLLALLGLSVGYLYRNRVLHTYYFADFMPFLSVLVGILYTELWEVSGE